MNLALLTFPALYCATILMLTGTGLFLSYIGLRLSSEGVSELWIGALTAAYYAGMVCGAKFGHRMIAGVGHVRSYTALPRSTASCVAGLRAGEVDAQTTD